MDSSPETKKQKSPTQLRNWSSLHDDLVRSILDRLASHRDFFAFAAVCKSWRSLAISTAASSPPLLLCSPLTPSTPFTLKTFQTRQSHPVPSLSFNSLRHHHCVGYSHGHLIFAARQAFIVNVFTGQEIHAPEIPTRYSRYETAVLSAPPSSSSSILFIVDWKQTDILYWRLNGANDDDWLILKFCNVPHPEIYSLCPYNGKVYGLLYCGRVFVVEYDSDNISLKMVNRVGLNTAALPYIRTDSNSRQLHTQNLVECDAKLLLVLMVGDRGIRVYMMDFEEMVWVEVESIGGWCLFYDEVARIHTASLDATRWGGRGNCVYVAGGYETWVELPLGKTASHNFWAYSCKWPSHVWVSPRDIFPSKLKLEDW